MKVAKTGRRVGVSSSTTAEERSANAPLNPHTELTLEVKLIHGPGSDINHSCSIAEIEDGEERGEEGAGDQVGAPELIDVGRL